MTRLLLCSLLAAPLALLSPPMFASETDGVSFFETKIRPALVKHCYECHSAASAEVKGGLRVDSRDALRKGGESGPAVVPGKLSESLVIEAIQHSSLAMPPDKKLPDEVIANFARWIEMGAPDPRDRPPSMKEAAELSWSMVFDERKAWWSLQPLQAVSPPAIGSDAAWSLPVDRFLRDSLTKAGLTPASPAEAEVLARRLAFVLTGLPPTPEQVTAFVDSSAREPNAAYAALVDELLASPHFGERFARHWMDVIRYGDTYGYEWDNPAKGAWGYRDYLIRGFNQDVGFDQMVREQIAGDLLAKPRINAAEWLNESLIGPMLFHLGEHRHGDSLDFNGIHQEMINNKIDAFSKAFLATTVACARCHDHKLDAVAQRDYYSLASVFMTPRWTSRVVDTPERNAAAIAKLKLLRERIRPVLAERWKLAANEFPREVAAALASDGSQQALSERSKRWLTAFRLFPLEAKEAEAKELKKSVCQMESLPFGEIHYPVHRLATTGSDAEFAALWRELSVCWSNGYKGSIQADSNTFEPLVDFRKPDLPIGWTTDGDGMRHGYVSDGTPLVALEGDRLVERLLRLGYHTHALSSKLPGSLRTPRLADLKKPYVSIQLAGGEWAGSLTLPENAFQSEKVAFFDQVEPKWRRFDTFASKPNANIRTEIATSDLNPNFPPRRGLEKVGNKTLADRDTGDGKRSWFSVVGIVAHTVPGAPADGQPQFATLYTGEPPKTRQEGWRRVGQWLAGAVDRWANNSLQPGDVELVNWLIDKDLLPNRAADVPELAQLTKEYRETEQTIAFPRTVNSMDERAVAPVSYPLNVRGNVDELGDQVPRDFLQVFQGQHGVASSPGSGRLELAEFLVSRDHPLTARVYVNRVWGWIFGEGLVRTPDDFGHLGQPPSHPELLDYLAREFIADGWSTKRLIRRLVMTRAFRQSGAVSQKGAEVDPDNRLLHHYPTRRLEAEAIRDTMLAVSGRLDRSLFGPSIDPPRAKEDPSKRLFSGPLDGAGRRSIYTKITIMEPPKLLAVFNQPGPKIPTGKRDVTNVPAQALTLLNDPFVAGQAEIWATALVGQPDPSVAGRIDGMFRRALGRRVSEDEISRWSAALREFHGKPNADEKTLLADKGAWTSLAHALFNTKEFIYYR